MRNVIDITCPPEVVWAWLVPAPAWPNWYTNSSNVTIEGGGAELGPGITFRWRTFGVSLRSRVEEFEPPQRLAWTGRGTGVDVYHAWLIEPRPEGSHVTTEETQLGWLARLGHRLRPNQMGEGHQRWLEELKVRAESGPPSSSR